MLKRALKSSILISLLGFILSLAILNTNSQAADTNPDERSIYKQTNKDGVVEFSDLPGKGTKPIRVPTMNTYKQQKSISSKAAQKGSTGLKIRYTELSIISPQHDTQVRANAGNVAINLKVTPKLHSTHTIKVIIDNDENLSSSGQSLSHQFKNISRGTHKVQAFVLDTNKKVSIKSSTVIFHLLRFAPSIKPKAKPKAKPKS